ncbi:hypothetical protein [Planctopirus hydrillae]|uniref:hypothetical protein n=1 Tax=Planctopirus hydrillae TaxID=1841610 RepID=UPI001042707F|nr:hypothetical protein [Planctopirus hydrillae]
MTPEVEFTNEWALPGKFVKNYIITYIPTDRDVPGTSYKAVDTRGEMVFFTDSELSQTIVQPYWILAKSSQALDVTVRVNSRNKTATTDFSANAPVVHTTATTTDATPAILFRRTQLGLGRFSPSDNLKPGFSMDVSVTTGSDQAGCFRILQLIDTKRFYTIIRSSVGTTLRVEIAIDSDGFVLDRKNEVLGQWNYQNAELCVGSHRTVSFPEPITDSPTYLFAGNAISGFVANEQFRTYVMYQPAGDATIWVPVKLVTWQWDASINRASASAEWPSLPNGSVSSAMSLTPDVPEWSGRILDIVETEEIIP